MEVKKNVVVQRTLSIIKPDATRRNLVSEINSRIIASGLKILAKKELILSWHQVNQFYRVHRDKIFFNDLCKFMASGPVLVQILEGEGAIANYRALMGSTDPSRAQVGTIRRSFAESVEANSVHGSDSLENSAREISFFFKHLYLNLESDFKKG